MHTTIYNFFQIFKLSGYCVINDYLYALSQKVGFNLKNIPDNFLLHITPPYFGHLMFI